MSIKTGDFGLKSGLKILDEADKKHGKYVFRDDVHTYRATAIKIFNLNYEEPERPKKLKRKEDDPKLVSFESPDNGIVNLG